MANLQVGVAGNGTVTVGAGASVHSPASNTLTLGTNNDERIRISSAGKILVGSTSARVESNGFASPLQVEGTSTATSSVIIARNSANASSSQLIFQKSRGTSVGSNTVIQSGDAAGTIIFEGSDGTNTDSLASIIGACDGTPGTNDVPGRLVFSTTADGAASPTERIRVYSDGCVGVGTMGADSRKDGHLQVETETTGRYAASFANHHASGSKGIRVTACDSDESNWILLAENRDGTNRFGVRGTGNVEVHDGDLVIGTAGHGIDFSATSDATGATSELLDDYEEGLHTVALTCSTSGTITLDSSYNTVAYHKIGNWVNIFGRVRVTSTSSPSGGQLRFSLPYQSASPGEDAGRVYGIATIQNADQNENHYGIGPTSQGNTYVQIHNINVDDTNAPNVCSQVNTNSLIAINVSYRSV